MQKSPEIEAIAAQAGREQAARDTAALFARLSEEPGFLNIGTAPGEWFTSKADFEQAILAVGPDAGLLPQLENEQREAYQEGTVGWGSFRGDLKLPNGATITVRNTFVLHQEGGSWKLVQAHASVAIPDDQMMNIH